MVEPGVPSITLLPQNLLYKQTEHQAELTTDRELEIDKPGTCHGVGQAMTQSAASNIINIPLEPEINIVISISVLRLSIKHYLTKHHNYSKHN